MMADTHDTPQRLLWIDVLKGIAIFFVVLGHSPYLSHLSPKVFNLIFSFHMPLFFFIAGYLFNPDLQAGDLFRKRFNSLLKPYLFTIILVSLIYIVFKSDISPGWYLFWLIYGNGPNLPKLALHLWFLPHLFLVTAFVWFLFKIIKILRNSTAVISLIIILFFAVGALSIHLFWNVKIPDSVANTFINNGNAFLTNRLLNNPAYSNIPLQDHQFILKGLPWSFDIILITAAFFITGYSIKKINNDVIFRNHYIALAMLIVFIVCHYIFNDTIDLNLRRYDNLFISTLLAMAGIQICVYLSNIICNTNNMVANCIAYIGRYSLIIYIFHLFIQSKAYYAILATFPNNSGIAFLPAVTAGIVLPLALNFLILERFKFFRFWYYRK